MRIALKEGATMCSKNVSNLLTTISTSIETILQPQHLRQNDIFVILDRYDVHTNKNHIVSIIMHLRMSLENTKYVYKEYL